MVQNSTRRKIVYWRATSDLIAATDNTYMFATPPKLQAGRYVVKHEIWVNDPNFKFIGLTSCNSIALRNGNLQCIWVANEQIQSSYQQLPYPGAQIFPDGIQDSSSGYGHWQLPLCLSPVQIPQVHQVSPSPIPRRVYVWYPIGIW